MTDLVCPTAAALAEAAAEWIVTDFSARSGVLAVSLSGGSTPKLLYETLARAPYVDRMPWDRVHWFWGDERFVPPDDPLSNERMARQAMLDVAAVPPANIHAVPTVGFSPEAAARSYEARLRAFHQENSGTEDLANPLFDLVLMGLGTNGHTASLFPDEAVLDERTAWAAPVTPPGEPTRITLTYPALESCRCAAFLVAGADKREMVARVRAQDATLPAGRYHPAGPLHWWLDEAAAG